MACKVNFADYVKVNAPAICSCGLHKFTANAVSCHYRCSVYGQKRLDKTPAKNIIIFTATYGQNAPGRSEDSGASAERHIESAAAGRARRTVPGTGVLRFPRSGSGQVRDAAARQQRRTLHQSSCSFFWIFPSFVLPGADSFRHERVGRTGSAEAWPQTRTQTHAADFGGCAQGTDRRCRGKVGGPDTDGAGTVWSDSSSADNRARIVAGSKKTPLNLAAADYDSGVISQYEDLRNHALTAAGLRQSLGYALFIGRGMAAWARACRSYASQPPAPAPTAPTARSSIPLDLRNQLALVLAGIILNLQTQEVCSC
jgi:hypothetical protein